MDEIMQESSKNDTFKALTESAINDFILTESSSVKNLKNQLEFVGEDFKYKDNKFFIREGQEILAVYLEDYIIKDLDNYLKNL